MRVERLHAESVIDDHAVAVNAEEVGEDNFAGVRGVHRRLLHRRHVRIDVIYEALSPRTRARLDAFTFVFFVAYMLTLIGYGGIDAWNSFSIGETTSTPWNPVIWPVKAAIPAAGLLLLLQGISNLIRDLGWVPGGVSR